MSYVDQNLLPNERVIQRAELHPAAFVVPAIPLVAGVLMMLNGGFGAMIGGLLALIGLFRIVPVVLAHFTHEMALTNMRIIGKSGLLGNDSLDVVLPAVSGIVVNQNIFGKLLNYGYVEVRSAGAGEQQGFNYIKEPQKFRNAVQAQLVPTT